jgi:hypothetical protein
VIERARGISISFGDESQGLRFAFTCGHPGYPDFSENGIEEQTRRLFEVCRLRAVPIITFVNKLLGRPYSAQVLVPSFEYTSIPRAEARNWVWIMTGLAIRVLPQSPISPRILNL